jgi:hypothetical protein
VSMEMSNQSRSWESFQNEGVGNGALEAFALDRGVEAWSFDPSERAIERLKEQRPALRRLVFIALIAIAV